MNVSGSEELGVKPPVIGLTTIWREAEGVDRVSSRSLMRHIAQRTWENAIRSPLTGFLTVFTIGLSIFLLGAFLLIIENLRGAVLGEGADVSITFFLREGVSPQAAEEFRQLVSAEAGVRDAKFRTAHEALTDFRASLGKDAAILEGLDEANPLPASVEATMLPTRDVAEHTQATVTKFEADRRVELVRYSRGLVDQLKRILRVLEWIGWTGLLLLLVLAGFIISNTIRLALFAHRTEIEIMQLVGANRSAIAAPYILEGSGQGVFGAVGGIVLVFLLHLFLFGVIERTELLRLALPDFSFLSLSSILILLLLGIAVGTIGSVLAVHRFLKEE
jgi:cell division transport system permease protein